MKRSAAITQSAVIIHRIGGHIHNRNGAGYTVANNSEAGTGNTGRNLGLQQTF